MERHPSFVIVGPARVLFSYAVLVALSMGVCFPQDSPEQKGLCRISTCDTDSMHKREIRNDICDVSYYQFLPRGRLTPRIKFPTKEMFFRPGKAFGISDFSLNKPGNDPIRSDCDEVWIETSYVNPREVVDITYTYWKHGEFVVSLSFAAADLSFLPTELLSNPGNDSDLVNFVYRQMKGEWFVLDSVRDRIWFKDEVSGLD